MAGEPVVHIGENSPEYIAYRLFRDVAGLEKKSLAGSDATRAWILHTYAECLLAVRNPLGRQKQPNRQK